MIAREMRDCLANDHNHKFLTTKHIRICQLGKEQQRDDEYGRNMAPSVAKRSLARRHVATVTVRVPR